MRCVEVIYSVASPAGSWRLPHTGADSERDACLAPAELADDNKMEKSAGLCRDERSLVIQALRTTSVEVLPKGAP